MKLVRQGEGRYELEYEGRKISIIRSVYGAWYHYLNRKRSRGFYRLRDAKANLLEKLGVDNA